MKNNKNPWVLVVIATVLLLALVAGYFLIDKSKDTATEPTEISETSLAGTVIIDNTDSLSDVLLDDQYAAVYEATADYIIDKVNKSIVHAEINGTPKVLSNGNVLFSVKTSNPTRSFGVSLDRSRDYGVVVFKVIGTNYQKTLDVFGSAQVGE